MQKEPHEGAKEIRPGKVEVPKPEPGPAPSATPPAESAEQPPEHPSEETVIAPDGEPEPKKDPVPLY